MTSPACLLLPHSVTYDCAGFRSVESTDLKAYQRIYYDDQAVPSAARSGQSVAEPFAASDSTPRPNELTLADWPKLTTLSSLEVNHSISEDAE